PLSLPLLMNQKYWLTSQRNRPRSRIQQRMLPKQLVAFPTLHSNQMKPTWMRSQMKKWEITIRANAVALDQPILAVNPP
ncbi:hypothetical protein GGI1_02075, partial [Acidithiobacillus sp. GGI-221]